MFPVWKQAVIGSVVAASLALSVGSLGLKVYSHDPQDFCGARPELRAGFSGVPLRAEMTLDGRPIPCHLSYLHGRVMARPETPLADGAHTARVRLSSALRTAEESWSFTVDTVPPVTRLITPAKGTAVASNEVTVTGKTEPGVTVTLGKETLPAGPDGSFSFHVPLEAGWNELKVVSKDRAGNEATTASRVFSDRESPALRFELPADAQVVKQDTFTLKAWGHDDGGLSACNISLDGGPFKPLALGKPRPAKNGVDVPLTFSLKKLFEGTRTVELQVVDRAGRSNSEKISFTVDSTEKFGEKTVTLGARGADIKELQRRLVALKLLEKTDVTGSFDEATLAAVQSLQSDQGVDPDGVVGPATIAMMGPKIFVNLSRFELVIDSPGSGQHRYPIACGMPAYPTPTGKFAVAYKEKNPTWMPPNSPWAREAKEIPPGPGNPLGTRWIGLDSGVVGIHGTNADYSIGSRASHGCLRMHISDVESLFELVEPGTPVTILSGSESDPAVAKYWP